MTHNIAVIIGSTLLGRVGPTVAEWFAKLARTDGRFEVDLVDLAEYGFPLPLGQGFPKLGQYHPQAEAFAQRMAAADAFVFVTPEYNHGYPASLKSALDSIYVEWNFKPASFVSYGGPGGGLRALEQLRQVSAELHLHDVQATVSIPFVSHAFDEGGNLKDAGAAKSVTAILNQLDWWSTTLKLGREQHPFQS